jgi:hypothetical protein
MKTAGHPEGSVIEMETNFKLRLYLHVLNVVSE